MQFECIGWWEQRGFGRQTMDQLVLAKEGEMLRGSGKDLISTFELEGEWNADGSVALLKKYTDRHCVLYVGRYDGEGSIYGSWAIGEDQGKWALKIRRVLNQAER